VLKKEKKISKNQVTRHGDLVVWISSFGSTGKHCTSWEATANVI